MSLSEAKKRNNAAFIAKCDRIEIRPRKDAGADIRAAANAAGLSVQAYVFRAVHAQMVQDGFQPTGDWTSYTRR